MDAHANKRDFFAINPDEAWRFLQAFDPTTTFWEFQAYDDNKTRGENGVKLYGTFQKKLPELQRLNKSSYAIGLLINVSNGSSYQSTDIVRGRAVFLDLDGSVITPIINDTEIPQPHCIVETSPGHFHIYWFAEDIHAEMLGKLEAVQLALARRFNGDKTACRRNQVPRLPGFIHNKVQNNKVYAPFVSRITQLTKAPRCKLEDFFKILTDEELQADERKTNENLEDEPSKVIAALEVVPNSGLDWKEWIRIGLAAWSSTKGNSDVFTAFDKWSQKDTGKYDAAFTSKTWSGFFKSPPNRIGAATIFHLADAAEPGWRKAYEEDQQARIFEEMRTNAARNHGPTEAPKTEPPKTEPPKDQPPPKDEKPKPPHLIETSAEFAANFVPPDYLIDGLIQTRFVYSMTGATGAGKTCVAMRWGAHVALGWDLDGREVKKGRVLFFAGENPDDVRMRWIKLCEEMGQDHSRMDMFFLPGVLPLSNKKIRQQINAEVERIGPISLLIVDTSAAYFEGDEENSNVQAGEHARMLRSFVNLPGRPTVLVTSHPTKTPNMDNLLPRGGGAFLNEVDGNLVCIKSDMTVMVHWHGKFRGPDFAPIHYKLQPGTTEKLKDSKGRLIWTITAAPITETEQAEISREGREREDDLLLLLQEHPGLSLSEMAGKLFWIMKDGRPNRSLVNRTLDSLIREKLVVRDRGKIKLTSKGKKAAEELEE
jgi:hypothetical protein